MNLTAVQSLSLPELVAECQRLNALYRAGTPEVEDDVYDSVFLARLRQLDPENPLLDQVEPEAAGSLGAPVRHSAPMLSTDKAYTTDEVKSWVARVLETATVLGVGRVLVRITPKLDGLAAFWNGKVLATRGDGTFGQDITRNIARGLVIDKTLEGPGEIVVEQAYFDAELREQYAMKAPRNFMVGLIGADTLQEHHTAALAAGKCRLVSYQAVESHEIEIEQLEDRWNSIMDQLRQGSPYLTDGAVVEVIDEAIRDAMGATSHHHRWMLALKTQGEVAQTTVESVTLQTGRTGRITPVMEVAPVDLSGATIRRCTAHTARHIERLGLGAGAKITLIRSGEVIPKLVSVESPSTAPVDLSQCPSCGHATEWDNDYLVCPNVTACPAQAVARLEHFFLRMGINGFGPKICETLVAAGHTDPVAICAMGLPELAAAGISMGVAANLMAAGVTRKVQIIKDNDVMAAFGIRHLGRGDSRKLLEVHTWQTVGSLSEDQIQAISGFGEVTARLIQPYLGFVQGQMAKLVEQGFKIEATVRAADVKDNPIKGKKVVFTGTMPLARDHMEQMAREMGATVQSGVSKTTDLLIFGDKAGSKLEKASQLGVKVMPVADYMDLLDPETAPQ